MSFPDKAAREKCWNSRDKYWECLNKNAPNHSSTSGEPIPKQCKELRKLFEKNCPAQWVKHFDRKRNYEQFKEKMQSGYDPLNEDKRSSGS